MQLHPTLVALFDHPFQGIPVGTWCLTLLSGQETAPRFELTLIEGIALRANLEDDHIHSVSLQLVELIGQRLLHLHCSKSLELPVNTLDPRATHLPLLLCAHCHREHQRHCQ